jgi:signal transduction histidine kinase/ligand-binding sensor domain-containing protein
MLFRLCTLVSVLLAIATAARAERLPITTYTTADGLAHIRVTRIVSDSRGFLWFCGPEGLSRFDGQRFTTYGARQGLANSINDFIETSRGAYWVATNGGGAYRFNPLILGPVTQGAGRHTDGPAEAANVSRFTALRVGDDLQTNRVNVLYEDQSGRLWAGTDGGLFYLDDRTDPLTFRRAELGLTGRPDPAVQVWAFAEDRERNLLIGTSWGLVRRSLEGRIIHTAVQPAQGTDHVRALLVDHESRLWIGHDTGLIVFRPGAERASFSRLVPASLRNPKLPAPGEAARYTPKDGVTGGVVRGLRQSADGQIWIATLEGLTQFDGERFRAFTRPHGVTTALALAEDREGNIWIGTLVNGALRLARNGFSVYTEADGLADAVIGAVFENRAGELYVISINQRIQRFDGVRFTAVRPNLYKDVADPVSPGAALQDRTGEWWIPGGAGLYRFPRVDNLEQLGRVRPKAIYTTRHGLAGDDVFRLFEDSRGDIWIGRRTPTSLVVTRWERATGTFHRYSDADGLPAFNRPNSFGEDHSGNIWVAFQNGGLARYRHGRFTLFTRAEGAPEAGLGPLYVDSRRRLWVGSARAGLVRIDSPTLDRPRFVSLTTAHGLSSDSVGYITEDQWGRLYLGMPSGRIDRLDPATGRVRHYGLAGPDVSAAYRDRYGTLWFGTYNGLYRLVPGPDRVPMAPTVLIGSLRVAGVSYLGFDLGQGDVPRFELEPAQNQLQIEFFALGAGQGDELRYQYRLEGADTQWNAPTGQRNVNYASLSPGRYRFVVRAVAADGAVSRMPATVQFTILRPIWQRWWFRSGAVLCVVLVVFAAHRYRVARLLALERVRMRIAADLHDDIGGSLSRISIQSEVACREAAALGEQPVGRLVEIAESARGLVDALADIVWSVDPRRDDLASVLRRIREYADDLLLGSGVRWTYTASPDLEHVRLDPQARRNLFLLLKEAVTNVARHAHARSVSLSIGVANGELQAVLQDDGRGFDPEALERGDQSDRQGIASMRARAERLGARLTIESSPGTGTTLSMQMSLRTWGRMIMLLSRRLR